MNLLPLLPLLLMVVLALGGCGSAPTSRPTTTAPAADQRAVTPATMAVERQWLQSWFKGTPVVIDQRDDGTVSVDVPRGFCFDPGASGIKPALAAVLDKVAESLRRVPQARLSLLAAPEDATGNAPLAIQRAAQVQKHLLSRGVALARLGKPTRTAVAAVQLRMGAAAP